MSVALESPFEIEYEKCIFFAFIRCFSHCVEFYKLI
jgi:hypothetical protein